MQNERHRRPTTCIVCGDSTRGYNYGAPSCPSCKAFFRRAIVKGEVFGTCSMYGLCATQEIGIPCRPCRFERCIKGGMNRQFVSCTETSSPSPVTSRKSSSMDEALPSTSTSIPTRTLRVAENRAASAKRQEEEIPTIRTEHDAYHPIVESSAHYDTYDEPFDELPELIFVENPVRIESIQETIMQNLIQIEAAHQKLRISTYTPRPSPGLTIDDFVNGPSKLGVYFEPFAGNLVPVSMHHIPLEIVIRNRMPIDLTNFDYTKKKRWQFQDAVYSIEFIKALPVYHLMDYCSKKTLIGSAFTCAYYTAAFYSYANHSDRTCYPDGTVITWDNEIIKQSPGSFRFYTGIIAAMREADLDMNEYALLKTIIVCNPLLEGLHPCDVTLLQHEKERYTKMLFSYVLARRGPNKGPVYFAKILSISTTTTILTTWMKSQCILLMALGLFKNQSPFSDTIHHSR
ncbi:hypothetical protein PRIPAC_95655 [Pristionchus pacificus]|uniref:Nuclear receptor n=1 Tax=Pristionchus pacificus TaxID=54126 RepID=A0A8R1YCU5_PRIPA|nr:hypothetical protein PRIPAC_95655 [Pristionchus pacificus]